MSPKRTKSADEIFCRSCGKRIKREAELCPSCGVRNKKITTSRTASTSPTTTHDPSDYETTVGENWYYAIIIPSIFTIPVFALILVVPSDQPLLTTPVMFSLLGAVFLPIIGIYFDRLYVRANSRWNPSILWMVGLFVLYPLNVFLALFYLYRRREVLGEP